MSIRITGPVLSALLYEHSSSDNDVEGLLLGSVTNVIKDSISDSSISTVECQTLYSIFSFIPCASSDHWYDNRMAVKDDSMKDLLHGHDKNELVGWFKLRRNSSMSVSMKERSISRHLLNWSRDNLDGKNRNLLFLLCVSQYSHQTALYCCDHQFMVYSESAIFVSIPETVTNLAESTRASYRLPVGHVTSSLCSYNRVLKKCKPTFVDENDESAMVGEIRQLNKRLHAKLKSLTGSVEDSEKLLFKELAEVMSLRMKIAASQDMVDSHAGSSFSFIVNSKSDVVPFPNSTADDELMLMEDESIVPSGSKKSELMSSDNSSDTVLLLDADDPSAISNEVSCLQPVPAAAASVGKLPTDDAPLKSFDSFDASSQRLEQSTSQEEIYDAQRSAAGTKHEPFGFVSDLLTNYSNSSPVKSQSNCDQRHLYSSVQSSSASYKDGSTTDTTRQQAKMNSGITLPTAFRDVDGDVDNVGDYV